MRFLLALFALCFSLTACLPEEDVIPSLHDIALYSNASDLRGLYGYIYGEPTTLNLGEREIALMKGRSSDLLAVSNALLIDGQPYLRSSLTRLSPPPTRVQRIPLTSDVQLEVGQGSRVDEVVYFDGGKWFTLVDNPSPTVGQTVVPKERFGGLRNLGELTLEEAQMLETALEPRAPVAVSLLPATHVPARQVSGLSSYRRTALYVQQTVPTDDTAYVPPPTDLVWEVIASGAQAVPGETPSFQFITNEAQLIEAWNRAYGTRLNVPPLPDVDFRRETLLAVFQATKSTGGYGLEVEGVSLEGRDIYVDVLETKPAAGTITTQALTTPWLMLRVLRGDVNAAWFRESTENALIGVAQRTN